MLSMEHLAEIVPGFEAATRRQRRSLVGKLFSMAPVTISRNAFNADKNSVSFENIFRSQEGLRLRWQTFTKTKFVELALDAYECRVLKEDKVAFTTRYISHSLKPCYATLDLGGVRDVPTRAHRSTRSDRQNLSSSSSIRYRWFLISRPFKEHAVMAGIP